MSIKYGLPTYPVKSGMDIGWDRTDEELEWLLDHGFFINTEIGTYRKIVKRDGLYVLLSGSHERHLASREEEVLETKPALKLLVTSRKFGTQRLGRWQWIGNEE